MNVGLRVFRGGDHFEKSSPRRVTDQHHKLPVLGVEVAVGRTLNVTGPEDRSIDPLYERLNRFAVARVGIPP